ncbi:MAG: GNAT family N-acetyltransferase [Clostridiales bacterium]|nr:GNAT family N-acetyltransferase [Clostridiales bacterium]
MDKGTQTIETERLILRKFKLADAQNTYDNYRSKEIVTKYVSWSHNTSVEDTKSYLADFVLPEYDKENTYRWAIVWKENNEVIGCIDVCETNERKRCAELGWCIGDEYWGRGIMPEAAKSVVEYLFSVGYERIQATHHVENKKSGRVMEKIGMQYEGILKKGSMYKNNVLVDCCLWAIVKP